MRLNILLVLFYVVCGQHYGQAQVDLTRVVFSSQFIIEDAIGSTDTVIMSYSVDGTLGLDSELGEVDINDQPFDSILDARLVATIDARDRVAEFSFKHAVGMVEGSSIQAVCGGGRTNFNIIIYAKHYPVTITWDSTIYRDDYPCFANNFITDNNLFETVEGRWDLIEGNTLSCLAGNSSYVLTGDLIPDWNAFPVENMGLFVIPVMSGDSTRQDTARSLFFDRLFTCPDSRVSTTNPNAPTELIPYPNPTTDRLTIPVAETDLLTDSHTVSIIDPNGRTMRREQLRETTIGVADLPPGLYYLRIDRNGQLTYSGRFVRAPH